MNMKLTRRNKIDLQNYQYDLKSKEIMLQSDYQESAVYEDVKNDVRQYILEDYLRKRLLNETVLDPKKRPEFDRMVYNYLSDTKKVVPGMTQQEVAIRIWQDLCSTGPLNDALEDDNIEEIQLDGWNQPWVKHKHNGKIQAKDIIKFQSLEHYETIIITKILNACGKSVSNKDPLIDAKVGTSRVSIVWSPISLMKGPIVTIRKFPPINLSPEKFIENGTATETMFRALKMFVEARMSMAMGGPTGSGKTTSYRMLAGFIAKRERTLVLEDTAELGLEKIYTYDQGYQFISEECRITGDVADITIYHLLTMAMRQTPDRIIIGEIRRFLDLLAAIEFANTGHPIWFTGHAGTAKKYIDRMVMMLRRADPSLTTDNAHELLADSLDVITIQRIFRDGVRRISEITEIVGIENGRVKLNTLFSYSAREKRFIHKNPISEEFIRKLDDKEIPEEEYQFLIELKTGDTNVA